MDDILKNKEKLLSFKDSNGNWETRRFLFSKWTLREGWDHPNVFVIAKLRTSGSENSKIQEVGRGLRLPVDENGHRLSQDELPSRLRFLVGYDEKDFANSLVMEVNDDALIRVDDTKLTESMINLILDNNPKLDEDSLLEQLDNEGIIKRNNDFHEGGFKKLTELYPEIINANKVKKSAITTGGVQAKQRIKLKKENWQQMRDLWQKFSNRYMLKFEKINYSNMNLLISEIMQNKENFTLQYAEFTHDQINYSDKEKLMAIGTQTGNYTDKTLISGMKYGEFIIKIAKATKLQPKLIHPLLHETLKNNFHGDTNYLNEITLKNIIRDFNNRFEEKYEQRFSYQSLDFQASTSVYDAQKDDFKDDVSAVMIGVNEDNNIDDDSRQLYETPPLRYDSVHPEKDLLSRSYEANITTFGKLPKKAIQVPKYTGGTTTPDFVFVVEKEDKSNVYLLVETKPEGAGKRMSDNQIIAVQNQFFGQLKDENIEYKEAETVEDVITKLKRIIEIDE